MGTKTKKAAGKTATATRKATNVLENTLVMSADSGKRMQVFMGRHDARILAKSILLGLDTVKIPPVLHRGDKQKFPVVVPVTNSKDLIILTFWDKDGLSGLKTEVLEKALKVAKRKQHKA